MAQCFHPSIRLKLQQWLIIAIIVFATPLSRAQTVPVDYKEISSGTLILNSEDTQHDALILNSKVSMHISGIIADVRLWQDFENSSNKWVEGIYVFPLPANASVRSMNIRVGDRTIEGKIMERHKAKDQYTKAKRNGKVTGVIHQERNNLFTAKIANIAPGEKVSIELDYFQTLDLVNDEFSLRFPTTLTPRYTPDDKLDSAHFIENPMETLALIEDIKAISPPQKLKLEDPTPSMTLQIIIDSQRPFAEIGSLSHNIEVIELEDRYLVSLQAGKAEMDRDFILNWKEFPETHPKLAVYEQQFDDERYALIVLSPPPLQNIDDSPRELIFVIDRSGSMAGNSIRAAKKALINALDKLQHNDKFNIIAFNNQTEQLYPSAQRANPEQVSNAKRYISQLVADGGTEMRSAFQLALKAQNESLLRQIVLITDGSVGNERELLHFLHNNIGHSRLFTVGIGSAPNSFFMRKAAKNGRGNFHFIQDSSNIEREISALFDQLQYPAMTSISIQTNTGQTEILPDPVPDLYAGETLVLSAKLTPQDHHLQISGSLARQPWHQSVSFSDHSSDSSAISSLWARAKIEQLMEDQWNKDDDRLHRNKVIDLSMKHQVLSAYTSFLAVETTAVKSGSDPLITEAVKNLMPAGSEMIKVNLPQGATGANAWVMFSLIVLLITGLIYLSTNRRGVNA